MKLKIEDRDALTLTPETDAEREQLLAVFGPFDEDDPPEATLPSPVYGKAVHLTAEGAVRVGWRRRRGTTIRGSQCFLRNDRL
jgi:hypothetical protein